MKPGIRTRFWRSFMRVMFKGRHLSVQKERDQEAVMARWVERVPRRAKVEHAHVEGLRVAWIHPPEEAAHKIVLYLHGGGYVVGSIDTHLMLCAPMAETLQRAMILPEYRLAPEHPFPAALEDALTVYRWLLTQGYAPTDIIFAGDSAGGGLSLAAALSLRDRGEPLPAAIVCLSPWADLTHSGQSHIAKARADVILTTKVLKEWALCYAEKARLADPLISPVFADLRGLPPILIQVGSEEILLDDSLALAEKAKAGGVEVTLRVWDGMWHVWHALGNLIPESRMAFEEIGQFVYNVEQKR